MIDLIIPTLKWPGYEDCVMSWITNSEYQISLHIYPQPGTLLRKMQYAFERHQDSEIIGFVHDDVVISEKGWDTRVLEEFVDPQVGLVGFAGATRHGAANLYTSPYKLSNLGRGGFRSNLREAEKHGQRFEGACNVAVLDGLAMFVRREVLVQAGGWPVETPIGYFAYDYFLSAVTRRQGKKIRIVGVACDHLSGKTASMVNLRDDFEAAHRYFYDNFRDVMPAEVIP